MTNITPDITLQSQQVNSTETSTEKLVVSTSYTLDNKEYGHYKSAMNLRFGFSKKDKPLMVIPIVCLVISLVSIILGFCKTFGENHAPYVVAIDLLVVALLCYFWVIPVIVRKKAVTTFMKDREVDYRHEMSLSIYEQHIEYTLNNLTNSVKWKDCKGISESSLVMVVLMDSDFSVVIPKRLFKKEPNLTIYKNLSKQLITYFGKKYIYHKSL